MEYLDEVLSATEKAAVERANEDEILMQALEKVLLAGLYDNGSLQAGFRANPTRNFALTTLIASISQGKEINFDAVGRDVWGSAMGVYLVSNAFKELRKLKKVDVKNETKENRAV